MSTPRGAAQGHTFATLPCGVGTMLRRRCTVCGFEQFRVELHDPKGNDPRYPGKGKWYGIWNPPSSECPGHMAEAALSARRRA